METNGHYDRRCFDLARKLLPEIAPADRYSFMRDFYGVTSSTIASLLAA